MVKDASPIKKKRKTTTSSDQDNEVDIYRKVIDFEEKEALNRGSTIDKDIFFSLCKELQELLDQLVNEKNPLTPAKRTEIVTEFCIKIALIKKLNRTDKIQHVFSKEALILEKQKCDSIQLVFQNLVYEHQHLVSEVSKCNSFKSKHEDIELIPFADFMKEAPESVTKKFKDTVPSDSTEEEQQILTLARLEFELQQRKELDALCQSLEEEKKKLKEDIVEKKQKLDGLIPLLTNILDATKPLQEHLNIPIDQVRAEQQLALLLPDCLYIFYANVVSYSAVYDSNLTVNIIGNQEEAMLFRDTEAASDNAAEDIDSDEADAENQETEEVVPVKKRRHRKTLIVDPMEEKKKKLLESHPLSIEATLKMKEAPSITLVLKYYPRLKIVTATSSVDIPSKITEHIARDILSGENILNELTQGDTGLDSPNPSTPYQLKKVNLGTFQSLVPQLGYAYHWAQAVCGIDFITKQNNENLGKENLEYIMKTLQKRLTSRHELANQLQQLEQNIIPELPETLEIPPSSVSQLTKWSSITYQTFCQTNFTQNYVEEDVLLPSDMYFSATITRNNAQLQVYIVIKNNYPKTTPMLCLNLNYNGVHNSANNDEIRDMEKHINMDWDKSTVNAKTLLSAQIMYLCSLLDVYLETTDPKTFGQNKMVLKNIRINDSID